MKNLFLIPLVLVAFVASGCENIQNSGTKEKIGGVSGAVVGGLLGSKIGGGSGQLWATGAGVLLGAFIGSEIGKSLDNADRVMLGQANQRAQTAPIGETVSWNNPDSGHYGTVTPVRDGESSYGRYCREYEQVIYVGGQQETAVGTACQNSDGTWEIVD
ncbi:MAG: glycine zipper 2TM domain-containing protein [Rhodospirillales bacterium]|nr:glycine zipper 2TM domain-containing protein [Rhodospirillales bacterium]